MNCKTNDDGGGGRLVNLKANCCTRGAARRDIEMSTFYVFLPSCHSSSLLCILLSATCTRKERGANDSGRRPWTLDNFIYERVNLPCSDTFTLRDEAAATAAEQRWCPFPTCIHLTLRKLMVFSGHLHDFSPALHHPSRPPGSHGARRRRRRHMDERFSEMQHLDVESFISLPFYFFLVCVCVWVCACP